MTEPTPDELDKNALPEPSVRRQRDWLPSLIWLIPIVAALVGITLVGKILIDRGPEIMLTFDSAEGLESGKTAVRYKDVQIGMVNGITLSSDRTSVQVRVQLDKSATGFAVEGSRFWVVRPRLDTSGISGLSTLLSGAYIGVDPGTSERQARQFKGLESPPTLTRGVSGRQFTLMARDLGSLDVGSPVYFRRIKVGQVASYAISPDGQGVSVQAFIHEPYAHLVRSNSRFWHASGIKMQSDANGVTVQTQSLATVLMGGIAFGTPELEASTQAKADSSFQLADNESDAMKMADGETQTAIMYFDQSLRGLSPGAPVDFRGVIIGEVRQIGVELTGDARSVRMAVVVKIYPDRLRRKLTKDPDAGVSTPALRVRRLSMFIQNGLRAQLRTGNLLTGQLYVAMDFFPKAPAVSTSTTKEPMEIPTVSGSFDQIQSQVQDLLTKLNKLPLDKVSQDARAALTQMDKTLLKIEQLTHTLHTQTVPEVNASMADAREALHQAQRALDGDAPLSTNLQQTLQELSRAAASIRLLSDTLERHPDALLKGTPTEKP
jgi:paraquat-inducible protein B